MSLLPEILIQLLAKTQLFLIYFYREDSDANMAKKNHKS
jgi:hypothetical protein